MAILRLTIYGGMVSWGVFKAGTEGYLSLSEMTILGFWKMIGDCTYAFCGVVLAFLDSTLSTLIRDKPAADAAQEVKDTKAADAKIALAKSDPSATKTP